MIKYTGIHRDAHIDTNGVLGDLYEVVVERDGQEPYRLDPRLDLINHSPTGVCWGYGGSGPAQCALGILADYLADDEQAMLLYQGFKWAVIARLDMDKGWELTGQQIEAVLSQINVQRMRNA